MPTEKAEYEQKQKTTHEFQNVFAPKNPFLFPFSTNLLKSPLASLPIHRPRLFLVSDLRPTGGWCARGGTRGAPGERGLARQCGGAVSLPDFCPLPFQL